MVNAPVIGKAIQARGIAPPTTLQRSSVWPVGGLRSTLRALVIAAVAIATGGLIAIGAIAPATADSKTDFTVNLASQKGTALAGVTVQAIPMSHGYPVEADLNWPLKATAVSGHKGQYKFQGTQQLTLGTTYTIQFVGAGSFTQFLGGVIDPADAETFVPIAGQTTLNATIRTSSSLTGKVTAPERQGRLRRARLRLLVRRRLLGGGGPDEDRVDRQVHAREPRPGQLPARVRQGEPPIRPSTPAARPRSTPRRPRPSSSASRRP